MKRRGASAVVAKQGNTGSRGTVLAFPDKVPCR